MLERKLGNCTIRVRYKKQVVDPFKDGMFTDAVNQYSVSITGQGARIRYNFFDSIHATATLPVEYPELMESILEHIKSDYYYSESQFPTLESFADEFGYDLETDYDKVSKIYKDCLNLGSRLRSVISEEDLALIED